MIRFIDLKTGNLFNGEHPYNFWFDNEQSINIIYSKPICFVSDVPNMTISLKNNPIFNLINLDPDNPLNFEMENIKNVEYFNIKDKYTNNINLSGTEYDVENNIIYIYIFYVIAQSDTPGEFITDFYIDKDKFTIGADFYEEDEELYINMSNKGTNISEAIQKVLYPSNVHEDKKDNILLNRKWKELLSNYWDIIDNKGSYKSLVNSLKWFEYGDLAKIYEIWKINTISESDKKLYGMKSITSILGDKFYEHYEGLSKTTYIAISLAMQKISKLLGKSQYDSEKNPKLENIISKWNRNDLTLKLSLLGSFFKTYFMPIHLDLMYSTIEDIVFTNTIKLINSHVIGREDIINSTKDIKCNIHNGDEFTLTPVKSIVNKNTKFGTQYKHQEKYSDINIFGVDENDAIIIDEWKHKPLENDELKTFWSQRYVGPGAIINFKLEIPLSNHDFIKKSVLAIEANNKRQRIIKHTIYKSSIINFKLLCVQPGKHTIKFYFETAEGYTFVKKVDINIIDTGKSQISIYRIKRKSILDFFNLKINTCLSAEPIIHGNNPSKEEIDYSNLNNLLIVKGIHDDDFLINNYIIQTEQYNNNIYMICISNLPGFQLTEDQIKILESEEYGIYKNDYLNVDDYFNLNINDYILGKQWEHKNPSDYSLYKQYIPASKNPTDNNTIGLNHLLIIEGLHDDDYLKKNYLILIKNITNNEENKPYTICVSKQFGFKPDEKNMEIIKTYNIYREDYIYMSVFHKLIKMEGSEFSDYSVKDSDAICVIPVLSLGKIINEFEWQFVNVSKTPNKIITLDKSINEPFVADTKKELLPKGFYNIIFKYSLSDEKVNTIKLNSAFFKL